MIYFLLMLNDEVKILRHVSRKNTLIISTNAKVFEI